MIVSGKEALTSLLNGVNTIANVVKTTLGPNGRNVILFNSDGEAYLTKDGVSVARKIKSENVFEDAGIQIIREATSKTAKEVGDGTTTTTILAQSLFSEGLSLLENYSIFDIKKGMYAALEKVNNKINEYSKKVTFDYDTLKNLATISSNNDDFIGNLVAEGFIKAGENGIVLFEESKGKNTYIDNIDGAKFNIGYASKDFINNLKKQEIKYENAKVLLLDYHLDSFDSIAPIIQAAMQNKKPLVVIAHSFSDDVLRKMLINQSRLEDVNLLPIKVIGSNECRKEILYDVASVVEGYVYCREELLHKDLIGCGECRQIITNNLDTIIVRDSTIKDNIFTKRIGYLKDRIHNETDDNVLMHLNERLAKLVGKVSTIYVGGTTDAERKERYDRVEDAVCATSAALNEGICEGGGFTYLKIANDLCSSDTPEIEKFVYKAITTPFKQLCHNSDFSDADIIYGTSNLSVGYNFYTNEYEDLFKCGVIDPAKVLRVALENAISAVFMLLTTSSIVYNNIVE